MLLEQYITQLKEEVLKTETQKYRLEDEKQTVHLQEYNRIIENREKDPILPRIPWLGKYIGEYSEKHHIRPKSLFPELSHDPKNIIRLLPKEHFAAHYHIWMHYRETGNRFMEEKMCCAIINMKKNLNNKYLKKFDIETDIDWFSEEYQQAKKRMSELRSKPMLKYDSDGNFLAEYDSIGCVISELGLKTVPIKLKNSMKTGTTFKGFAWRYKTSDEIPQKIEVVKEEPKPKILKIPTIPKNARPILKYSLDGEFLEEYPSIAAASKDKRSDSTIRDTCNGKRLSTYGFIWRFKENEDFPRRIEVSEEQKKTSILHAERTRAVLKLDMNGNVLERFNCIKDAAKSIGTCHSVISRVCSGERKQALGFVWKYEDEL